MTWQCAQDPAATGGTCVEWVEVAPLFPPLTLQEGGQIGVAILMAMAVAWAWRLLRKLL